MMAASSAKVPTSLLERARRTVEHPSRVALCVVAVSLLVRVAAFAELSSGPCLLQHRWTESDMSYFDAWARQIAAGDWLSRDVRNPMHGWHRQVAGEYLSEHPAEAAELGRTGDPARALWSRWTGGARFYQDPLYPYLVAITYSLFGDDPRWVLAWQVALGAAISVVVYLLSRRLFGPACGAIAGLMAALYAPLVFLELVLLREVLIAFAGLGLVLLCLRAAETSRWTWWGAFGLAAGLSCLVKSTFPLAIAGLGAGAVLVSWRGGRSVRWPVAAAALGLVLGLAPLVARNVAVGVAPLSTASSGTLTFVSMNAEDYPARGGFFVSRHAARILGESDGQLVPAALATLRTHPDAGSWVRQLWEKLAATLSWYEIPNNENFYYYRLHSAVLRSLPVTFFLVSPLAIVGLVLALRRARECWPLYVLVLASLLPLLLFMTVSRLRLPLAIALIPFAAHALAQIGRWVVRRTRDDLVRAAVATAAAAGLLAWTGSGNRAASDRIRPADYVAPLDYYYRPEAIAAGATGDWRRASAVLSGFLETEPEEVRAIGPGRPPASDWEATLLRFYAFGRTARAEALEKAGDAAGARADRARARAVEPFLR